MKLVEVIRGVGTSDETFAAVQAFAVAIGKEPVEVKECPGFVVNRILIPMINEAVGLYAEGIASAEGIDTAMRLGCNHPMGPLQLGDLIGLDVVLAIMDTLLRKRTTVSTARIRCCANMCAAACSAERPGAAFTTITNSKQKGKPLH